MNAPTTAEQRARALVVLLAVAVLYRARSSTLLGCIDIAAADSREREYTLRVLRGVLWTSDLLGWESHPTRRRADVWRALKTATRWCSRRAGGWSVTGLVRPAAAKVPASRQWLEWLPVSR